MGKIFSKYNFLILSSIFVIIFSNSIKVEALSYKSDFVPLEDQVQFSTKDFKMNLRYAVFLSGTAERSGAITGYAVRTIDTIYYYHYIVYYYNDNKVEIGATDGYNGMWNKSSSSPSSSNGSYIRSPLEQKNMYDGYSLSDIKYYKLFIEPATEEVTNNYLHNDTKLNANGLDKITDSNTVSMSAVSTLNSSNTTSSNGNSYSYVINSYDINVNVRKNNTLKIAESLDVYFNVSKHGIFRKIPLRNKITRLNGTKSSNRAKISDITVSDKYSLSNENGYKVIKIGDANKTLTGQKNYTISYLYNLGKDTGKDYDELYFNLIGDEWDTSISNVTFTITMPKEFDKSKLGFSSGTKWSTDSSKVSFTVDGNVITGHVNGTLSPKEALTVRLELPEGYFVGASNNLSLMMILIIIVPLIFLLISYLLWKKYGKDDQVVETVEFYPPSGFNSLEIGFLYKGKAKNEDVVSLLIYLANKGYIKITEIEEKQLFSTSKDFTITKLKDYDGNNVNEKLFFNGLFKNKHISVDSNSSKDPLLDETNRKECVTSSDLYNSFYITLNKIIGNINDKKNKQEIFEKTTKSKSIIIAILIIASLLFMISIPTLEYAGFTELMLSLFITLFYIPFYAVGILVPMGLGFKIFWLGFTIIHSFFFFSTLPITDAIMDDPFYLIAILFGLLCVVGMTFCLKAMPKRTPYGNEILGKIRGFKTFLETAEKEKLEAMVVSNPTYFYDILPYTYVLGISDKWIKKFEAISLQAPTWYDSTTGFDIVTFGSFMNSTMSSAESSMSSSPSSSSSSSSGFGGSSGGGFSGGGSGGGGGGSW